MTKIGKLFVGLVALILLWMLMLFFNWHRIETELKNASALVLDQAGYDQLEIDTDHQGRTVVLSGVMRSTENIDHATSLVAGIEGVHRVQTDSIELKPYSPANISLKSNQASITLLGSLSSDAVAKQLNGQITKAMGRRLDHGLSIDPDVESPPWLIGLATGVPALEPIDDLDFEIKDRKLRIAGISRDSASHQSALKAVSNLPGIQAADISGLVLKPFNPSWFALSDRSVRGTVSTAGESFRLKRLFADFAGVDDVTGIQVDSEFSSAEWLSDLERVVGNAGGVESPTISYRDGVIKVAGIVREQQDFDALAAQAPYLMHTRQLNLAEVELRPFQTPWLDMRVTEEKILLQGLVRQAKTANELLQNIANATGSTFERQIENQLKVSTDVSPGEWAPAVGRLVAGMAKIE
ncbi:MAG: BON domain-containing protein, partial [Acidiferrobacterales bacterium]|nr:BON domain-containing protein [Acidiferrobacterales bacterium]